MPLPENWNGVFYDEETGGDLLFDMNGESFVSFTQENPEQGPPFLVAGAVFDLAMHGYKKRAGDFLAAGCKVWPDAPWGWFENMLQVTDAIFFQRKQELPKPLRDLTSQQLQRRFLGCSIEVIPVSSN